ncbi:MAG: tetratricopeptide repeat protein [Candidatus Rokubacteria bacterium]|nr:tetratricopeptide repeat protein [Candidatus Rokubacteria bacterium]
MGFSMCRAAVVLLVVLACAGLDAPPAAALEERERLLLVGERAFQDRLHALSRQALERFLERYPSDARAPEATLLLGKARLALGALDAALDAFRRAQGFSPPPGQPEEARFWEGETLFRLRRFEAARAVYDRLLADNAASPLAPDALYGLGWAQLELKQREAAITAFRQLIEAFPEHSSVPSATVYLARTLVEAKRFEEAAGLLSSFPERHPNHALVPDARYLLGYARVSGGHTSQGLADLRAFIAAHPGHELAVQARRMVVAAVVRGGRKDELAQEYSSLMAQSPRTAEALYDAGLVASQLGRPRDAESAWAALRTEFPKHALAARASLDLSQSAFGRSAFKDALALARAAARSEEGPLRAQAFLLAGESELKLKHYPQAHQAFQSAVELAGEDAVVRFRALAGSGLALEEQGQWQQAARHYDQVAAGSPDKELQRWAKGRRAALAPKLKPAAKKPAAGKARKP